MTNIYKTPYQKLEFLVYLIYLQQNFRKCSFITIFKSTFFCKQLFLNKLHKIIRKRLSRITHNPDHRKFIIMLFFTYNKNSRFSIFLNFLHYWCFIRQHEKHTLNRAFWNIYHINSCFFCYYMLIKCGIKKIFSF